MKIKASPQVWQRAEGEKRLLHNWDNDSIVLLNSLGQEIFDLCKDITTEKAITEQICSKYKVDRDIASEDTSAFIDELLSMGFVEQLDKPQMVISNEKTDFQNACFNVDVLTSPVKILWECSYLCNLACPHCYTNSGGSLVSNDEMDTESALHFIDKVADVPVSAIYIGGGEPFLRKDIYDLLAYIKNRKNIWVEFNTNTLPLHKKNIYRLGDIGVDKITVSLDGIDQVHDDFRGKNGLYTHVISVIKNLIDANIKVRVETVVTKANVNQIGQIIDTVASLGVDDHAIADIVPMGRILENKDLIINSEEACRVDKIISKKRTEYNSRIYFASFVGILEAARQGEAVCGIGKGALAISANGQARACPTLSNYSLGNIQNLEIKQIWDGNELDELRKQCSQPPEECGNCELVSTCNGGCRGLAFENYNTFNKRDPRCAMNGMKTE